MCMAPKAPAAQPAPAPLAPPPPPTVMQGADGTRRTDAAALGASRGRSALRIDKTSNGLGGGSGSGLNIPT